MWSFGFLLSALLSHLAVLLPGLNIPLHVLGLLFTRPRLPSIRQLEFGNVLVILVLVIDDTSFFIDCKCGRAVC